MSEQLAMLLQQAESNLQKTHRQLQAAEESLQKAQMQLRSASEQFEYSKKVEELLKQKLRETVEINLIQTNLIHGDFVNSNKIHQSIDVGDINNSNDLAIGNGTQASPAAQTKDLSEDIEGA